MTYDEFQAAIGLAEPPAGLEPILLGLWLDAKGQWDAAHRIAQGDEGRQEYDRLHAYLHRKEGHADNARYWYNRCGEPVHTGTLEEEWAELARRHCEG
jgi:hypothetical protein